MLETVFMQPGYKKLAQTKEKLSNRIASMTQRTTPVRIGIIGCDTSHAIAFTENLNNPDAKSHVSGGKVVAAFKGASPDIPASANRVEGYSKTLGVNCGKVTR